jgi:hypothetical protein
MYKCINGHSFHAPAYFGDPRGEFSYDLEGCPHCRSPDYEEVTENRHDGKEKHMNCDTGELKRLESLYGGAPGGGMSNANGFVQLLGDEARQADEILGDKESVFLPEEHPLRRQVTERVGKPATERQLKAIWHHRKMMGDKFWPLVKANCPDIMETFDNSSELSCGQAQRLLNMLQSGK